jgi:hypothetical protein
MVSSQGDLDYLKFNTNGEIADILKGGKAA